MKLFAENIILQNKKQIDFFIFYKLYLNIFKYNLIILKYAKKN
jgi:hypothetical protein